MELVMSNDTKDTGMIEALLQPVAAKLTALYHEITVRALENEKKVRADQEPL